MNDEHLCLRWLEYRQDLERSIRKLLRSKSDRHIENFVVKCDQTNNSQENIDNNTINVELTLHTLPLHFNGMNAFEIRNAGFDIKKEIPDCAIYKNGMFEWVNLELAINKEDNDV